tara:strand:- start:24890 stop:30169 length:5280 start_codon:yes stop_codon:yes gene_type:complete
MANVQRNFVLGRMNKSLDERLLPNGEYVDAMNVRLGSTEQSEVGSVENAKGNTQLTTLQYDGQALSTNARCIGAFEDGATETLYWFVHDPDFALGATGKLDLVVSLNTLTNVLTYHIISIDDGGGTDTTLNFNPSYLITGVNLIEDLLFWTDDYNPPRFINVNRNYANPVVLIDGVTEEELLVIKKPPADSPTLTQSSTVADDTFLEDRFVCFGYRWKYKDDDYSATSQFTEPSFIPQPFNYSYATGLNEGMLNNTNLAVIEYNSGGPLVTGIDLLWKDMQNGSIRIIEKLDKDLLGLVDNTDYSYSFSSSQIFTVLPISEILRLYDNVPRLAKAQTLMGNRIIYGNYLEQYDLTTLSGFPTKLEYTISLDSEDVGLTDLSTATSNPAYTWDGPQSGTNSEVTIQGVGGLNLTQGALLEFQITFQHSFFTGDLPFPADTTPLTTLQFSYLLPQSFPSAYDLAISTDFVEKIGTALNIQTVADCALGTTFTDNFNCSVLNTLSGLTKYESGISAADQPVEIVTSPASPDIGFILPIVRYVDDPTGVAITQEVFEYYEITASEASFSEIGNPKSLHSKRGYQIGIVYMDDFNRATTALVSPNNSIEVPCENSVFANRIRVNIPTTQIAPEWATRYKFVCKQDKENYWNVYTQFFFRDPISGSDYFLLEGQNARKVEEGDLLRVKLDTNGALSRCVQTSVLEKVAQEQDFLDPPPQDSVGNEIPIPAGVYAKMRANNFSTETDANAVVSYGEKTTEDTSGNCSHISYPAYLPNPDFDSSLPSGPGNFAYVPVTIPAGSRINIRIDNLRKGKACATSGVERRKYLLDTTLIATQDYPNAKAWWDGDNVASILSGSEVISEADCGASPPTCTYIPALLTSTGTGFPVPMQTDFPCDLNLYVQFFEDDTISGAMWLVVVGMKGYSGNKKKAVLKVNMELIRGNSLVVFETEPQDALPDVWFESSKSYPIDQATGYHQGNIQNQTAVQPAIIKTEFFNCYAFGNGVESYQIQDSITGKVLTLGNRVFTTNNESYMAMRRYSDLTYSGVYNDESNVNKLNEFNLGLLNFKPLEERYGPIYLVDGRETDVLTLQEDKISYVLQGKNLLSDSVGGGTIASVPEVLGTQIARIEDFGVSQNPESYAKWGPNKFFTDAKRGAVIQLRGSSAQNEQLQVISEAGMRSWFRDLFLQAFNTQKLGGYDPYMNEFVLSSNNELLPNIPECIECGISRTVTVTEADNNFTFCVNVGNLVGDVNIDYNIISTTSNVKIDATYNAVTTTTGFVNNDAGSPLVVDKDNVAVDTVDIEVEVDSGETTLEITVNCPDAQEITIIQVCYSLDNDAGEFIHNEFRWVDGMFVSPLHSEQVELVSGVTNPLISQYSPISGPQGAGFIPNDGATITIISNRILPIDDYEFDPAIDELRYLRSNTLYLNNPVDMAALLFASTDAVPITGGPNSYEAQFTMPVSNDQYLYLIYNYRRPTGVALCYDASDMYAACCECTTEKLEIQRCQAAGILTPAVTFTVVNTVGAIVGDLVSITNPLYTGCKFEVIGTSEEVEDAVINILEEGECSDVCNKYTLTNTDDSTHDVTYVPCDGAGPVTVEVPSGGTLDICATDITLWDTEFIEITFEECDCEEFWLMEECTEAYPTPSPNYEVVDAGAYPVTANSLWNLTGHPSCVYKALYRVALPVTDTISGVPIGVTSCQDVCGTYQVDNPTLIGGAVDYKNCAGVWVNTGIIAPGGTLSICAEEIGLATFPAGFEVSKLNCGCE